jgi:molybdate transport system substrate-binding protein
MRMSKLFFGLLSTMTRAFVLGIAGLLTGVVEAAVVKVVSSGGFAAAYRALAPEFEHTTANILATSWGPSMGNTPDAIPLRIQRGEPIDVVNHGWLRAR